ncbi:hypothetical protein QVD17_19069 [Tagetes erecta]|uniref:Uncharacterized protein n=1 Tax=Tagetes erecta TaxID=13708 RepID=A0AAD8KMB9_TARER|nr:hypothetical protein QVD17_19069 [Tagetes erecta]
MNKSSLFESCANEVVVEYSVSKDDCVFTEKLKTFKISASVYDFDYGYDSDLKFSYVSSVLKSIEPCVDDDFLLFMHDENVCEKQLLLSLTLLSTLLITIIGAPGPILIFSITGPLAYKPIDLIQGDIGKSPTPKLPAQIEMLVAVQKAFRQAIVSFFSWIYDYDYAGRESAFGFAT